MKRPLLFFQMPIIRKIFSGIGIIGLLLNLWALIAIIAWEIGAQSEWFSLPVVFAFYFIGHIFQAFSMAFRESAIRNFLVIIKLSIWLSILSLFDFLIILPIMIIVLLNFVSGPIMFIIAITCAAMLGTNLWELAFGDIKGVSGFSNMKEAAVGTMVMLLSSSIVVLRFSRYGNYIEDKGVDLLADFRDSLRQKSFSIMKKDSSK